MASDLDTCTPCSGQARQHDEHRCLGGPTGSNPLQHACEKRGGRSAHHTLATAFACSSSMLGQSHSRATYQPSTPVLAARAARREKLSEACHENRAFHCDLPSESAVFAMHAAVQTPKVVRQPAHHCELGLRPRGAQQRRLRGQNVPTPVRSAVFRSRSSGGAARDLSPWDPRVPGTPNWSNKKKCAL